jgi:hypothetical protein
MLVIGTASSVYTRVTALIFDAALSRWITAGGFTRLAVGAKPAWRNHLPNPGDPLGGPNKLGISELYGDDAQVLQTRKPRAS